MMMSGNDLLNQPVSSPRCTLSQLLAGSHLDDGSRERYVVVSSSQVSYHRRIKYSLDFLRPIKTTEAFKAVDWLADLLQRTWPQAGHR